MKKNYFTVVLLFLLVSFAASAQNVGIGTTVPTGKLHIDLTNTTNTTALLIDDDDDAIIQLRRSGLNTGFMQMSGNDFRIGTNINNDSGRLVFRVNGGNRMFVAPNGFVGVGTANPLSKFHIVDGTDVSLTGNGFLMLGNETGANVAFDNNEIQARNNGVASNLFMQASGGRTVLGNTNDENIQIQNGSIQSYFNGSGGTLILQGEAGGTVRLGNGFDFANTKLHVSTGVDAGLAPAQSGYMMLGRSTGLNLVFDNNEILARDNGQAATLYLARDGSKVQLGNGTEASGTKLHITNGSDVALNDANSGYIMMGSQGAHNLVLDNNEIQARNNGAAAPLYLQNLGSSVFIGNEALTNTNSVRLGVHGSSFITGNFRVGNTTVPDGYKMAVDGSVVCTEVLVQSVANWPDYVFSEKYKLKSFDELRKFINDKKHLPNIPSAKEIEASGIEVGEMQRRMIEKIEELTLYILHLEKEMQELKHNCKN